MPFTARMGIPEDIAQIDPPVIPAQAGIQESRAFLDAPFDGHENSSGEQLFREVADSPGKGEECPE